MPSSSASSISSSPGKEGQASGMQRCCFVHTLDPVTPAKATLLHRLHASHQGRLPSRPHLHQWSLQLRLSQNAIRRWWTAESAKAPKLEGRELCAKEQAMVAHSHVEEAVETADALADLADRLQAQIASTWSCIERLERSLL